MWAPKPDDLYLSVDDILQYISLFTRYKHNHKMTMQEVCSSRQKKKKIKLKSIDHWKELKTNISNEQELIWWEFTRSMYLCLYFCCAHGAYFGSNTKDALLNVHYCAQYSIWMIITFAFLLSLWRKKWASEA